MKAKDRWIGDRVDPGHFSGTSDDDGRITQFDESAKILLEPMLRSGESARGRGLIRPRCKWPMRWRTAIEDSPGKPLAGALEVRRGSTEIQGTGTAFKRQV